MKFLRSTVNDFEKGRFVYKAGKAPAANSAQDFGQADVPKTTVEKPTETIESLELLETAILNYVSETGQTIGSGRLVDLLNIKDTLSPEAFRDRFNQYWSDLREGEKKQIIAQAEPSAEGTNFEWEEFNAFFDEASQSFLEMGRNITDQAEIAAFVERSANVFARKFTIQFEELNSAQRESFLQRINQEQSSLGLNFRYTEDIFSDAKTLGATLAQQDIYANLHQQAIESINENPALEIEFIARRLEGLDLSEARTAEEVRAVIKDRFGEELQVWLSANQQALQELKIQAVSAEETKEEGGILDGAKDFVHGLLGENSEQALNRDSALGLVLNGVEGVSPALFNQEALLAVLASDNPYAQLENLVTVIIDARIDELVTDANFPTLIAAYQPVDINNALALRQIVGEKLQTVPDFWSADRIEVYREYVEATGAGAMTANEWRAHEIGKLSGFEAAVARLGDMFSRLMGNFKSIPFLSGEKNKSARKEALDLLEQDAVGIETKIADQDALETKRGSLEIAQSNRQLKLMSPDLSDLNPGQVNELVAWLDTDTYPEDSDVAKALKLGLSYDTLAAVIEENGEEPSRVEFDNGKLVIGPHSTDSSFVPASFEFPVEGTNLVTQDQDTLIKNILVSTDDSSWSDFVGRYDVFQSSVEIALDDRIDSFINVMDLGEHEFSHLLRHEDYFDSYQKNLILNAGEAGYLTKDNFSDWLSDEIHLTETDWGTDFRGSYRTAPEYMDKKAIFILALESRFDSSQITDLRTKFLD